jgi:hypothetical protein
MQRQTSDAHSDTYSINQKMTEYHMTHDTDIINCTVLGNNCVDDAENDDRDDED